MWQVLLAAAVAGSGYVAKQLLHTHTPEPTNSPSQYDQHVSESSNLDVEESVFKFSSNPGAVKKSRKKLGGGCKGIRGNVGKVGKKCGLVEDQKSGGRRFGVCLKKRRINKHGCATKCECATKGSSSFGWGVGVGVMYMMSAGKGEISKLNTAMDETAKVVQELKTELARRKSSRSLTVSSSPAEGTAIPKRTHYEHSQRPFEKSINKLKNVYEVYGFPDEGECASSILTEEPQMESLEMDQLEAELESELLKLPGYSSDHDGGLSSTFKVDQNISDAEQNKVSVEDTSRPDGLNLGLYPSNGVLPSELDQKLCQLLIEQQESHIVELETNLQRTNTKLSEKEAELQALKDCVKRLTEFSLANISDEEIEAAQADKEKAREVADDSMECDSWKSVIGIKRALDRESYGCCTY